jgi:beta-RFAP synthase
MGRGERSALGFHGFFQGGFLVEAGKKRHTGLSPLVARLLFPENWRVVLVIPAGGTGLHGFEESEVFQHLLAHGFPLKQTESLCRLVMLGLLPALVEADWKSFGEALFEFNSLAGQAFVPFQGGTYANFRIAELIQFIRGQGFSGAGQSSWGPTVFAIAEDQSQAKHLARRVREKFSLEENEVVVTSGSNQGAKVSLIEE